ncbi:CsbD family protein [Woodsholea maritima]|uniref:CsbD family protein n=1 Tax=Woodsholea maritima TaxID=240237 RepID=UPI000370972E|nr:CsbD family protein [Woodsholea maritima]
MNSDELKGRWKQVTGEAKRQWGKLTDDDAAVIDGDREKLVGKIQEKYGKSKEEAEQEVHDWVEKI